MNDALHLFDRTPAPGKRAAAIMAVAVHLLLALFLIYGIRWQSMRPEAVEVELISTVPMTAPKSALKPPPEIKPEPQPEPKIEPPPKPVTPPKPDIALKEKPEKKPEPPKPLFDPMEALKRETEQAKREQMSSAASKELAQLQANASSAVAKGKADGYIAKIRGKVYGNLVPTPGVVGNPEAVFDVIQLPSGEILELRLVKSSGHAALDSNIERAIRKSSPLPLPERPDEFRRELRLKFRPIE